jgi:Ca2+-binding EF-hand superfamily protein
MPNPIMQKIALKKLFKQFDDDKNKSISFDEFVGVVLSKPELLGTTANLRRYFTAADIDGDGMIDAAELQKFLHDFFKDNHMVVAGSGECISNTTTFSHALPALPSLSPAYSSV